MKPGIAGRLPIRSCRSSIVTIRWHAGHFPLLIGGLHPLRDRHPKILVTQYRRQEQLTFGKALPASVYMIAAETTANSNAEGGSEITDS
jgi:hypothetical protein